MDDPNGLPEDRFKALLGRAVSRSCHERDYSGSKKDSRASRTGSPSRILIWRSYDATGNVSDAKARFEQLRREGRKP
jgi:hypothetical protein